jgi:hypothetical protein
MDKNPTPDEKKFEELLTKINKLKSSGSYDLSMEEDLSLAVMNLISLEEHFFFTAKKTGKDDYLDMLAQVREMRKTLMKKMIPQYEGEAWCVCKHLLSTTMRMIEVGTKHQTDGKHQEAKELFGMAYKTFTLFWAVRLKLVNLAGVKKIEKAVSVDDLVSQLIDCCKE